MTSGIHAMTHNNNEGATTKMGSNSKIVGVKWLFRAAIMAVGVSMGTSALAGSFLEMPDTTEVPKLERESLLLDMDIPEVRNRNPDPRSGPRLNVREFRVQGIVEYPEMGIYRDEIIQKVENIRFEMMDEDEMLESGYTLEELAAVSDLIAEIEEETKDRHVGPLEVQRLVFHIREQRRKRGITLGMIERVADTITNYYRERGFILAKAYIPKQKVRDGVVTLTVLLGDLGEVGVENNQRYSDRTITRIFDPAIDKPVKAGVIEERLFFVNDLPGLRAQAYFEPGAQVGDSRITVNVTEERWFDANLRTDNHGSESSGEYRLYGDFLWNNPLGLGDRLKVGVLNSFEPDNSVYGSFRYSLPAYFPRLRFSTGVSNNDFSLGGSNSGADRDLNIVGESQVIDAGFEYQLARSRVSNHAVHLTASEIESSLDFLNQDEQIIYAQHSVVHNIELEYRFDVLNEDSRILHQGGIGVVSSEFVERDTEEQEESPWILPWDYTLLAFWEMPFVDIGTRIIAKASGQYSGTSMDSVNQFSLAGPRKARGYATNAFLADDGIYAGLDWIFPGYGPLKEYVQPMVFFDTAYGEAHAAEEGSEAVDARMTDVGLGLRINYGRDLRGSLSVANPIVSENSALSEDETMDDGVRLYFDMQYSF